MLMEEQSKRGHEFNINRSALVPILPPVLPPELPAEDDKEETNNSRDKAAGSMKCLTLMATLQVRYTGGQLEIANNSKKGKTASVRRMRGCYQTYI